MLTKVILVDFLSALRKLQEIECEELGIDPPNCFHRMKLPDGRPGIYRRLWNTISTSHNFHNDVTIRVFFEDESYYTWDRDKPDYKEFDIDLSSDYMKLYTLVKEADVGQDGTIYFEICW